jgi:cytochrome c-type biogenesis protein CcmH/NrfF
LILAHAGHWLTSLLYVVPVLVLVIALSWQSWRDRRRGYSEADTEPEPSLDDILDGRA